MPSGKVERRYLSMEEAAVYLGLSPLTIRRRIADGTIPAYRLGSRTTRIDLRDLEAALRPIPNARTVSDGGRRG